jgi:hypothetical protein
MPQQHKVTPSEIGMIRIYLKPSDKIATGSRSFWSRKPLYRELVAQAKRDGIMNAVAHNTHYGYSNHGPVRECSATIWMRSASIRMRTDCRGATGMAGLFVAGKI